MLKIFLFIYFVVGGVGGWVLVWIWCVNHMWAGAPRVQKRASIGNPWGWRHRPL